MEKYSGLLPEADSATFATFDKRGMAIPVLKTRKGKVIGALECYERTRQLLQVKSKSN